MISSLELQAKYNNLYEQIRKYIWRFDVVNSLADLEIEVYKSFPDINQVRKYFYALNYGVSDTARDDEDLKSALDSFKDMIESDDDIYTNILRVNEVIQDEAIQKMQEG